MYLVDTHTLVWFFTADNRLSRSAKQILTSAEKNKTKLILPLIVLAEMEGIFRKFRIKDKFLKILAEIKGRDCFLLYPFSEEVFEEYLKIDSSLDIHDRIIVASAKLTGSVILSKDSQIKSVKEVKIIW